MYFLLKNTMRPRARISNLCQITSASDSRHRHQATCIQVVLVQHCSIISGPRARGGTFILRVEDTDEERSTEDSMRAILSGLKWLGLDWDEGPDADKFGESIGPYGPYYQSMRRPRHQEYLKILWDAGHVFYCPATSEEMMDEDGKKKMFSPYHDISREEQEKRLADGPGDARTLPLPEGCGPRLG